MPVLAGQTLQGVPDIGLLLITSRDGRPVYVKDVANVVVGAAEPQSRVWTMTQGGGQGSTSGRRVSVAFAKRKGANAVIVTNELLQRLEIVKGRIVPEGLSRSTVTRNFGETATEKADELLFHLSARHGVDRAADHVHDRLARRRGRARHHPDDDPADAVRLVAEGYTLNRVSLFALIFSIGILVDDAIVVVENIVRHWSMRGQARPASRRRSRRSPRSATRPSWRR